MRFNSPDGRIKIPPIRVIIRARFILKRIITPPSRETKENKTPRANQKLLIVLQNIQQTTLQSGSPRLMGTGVHQTRQYTRHPMTTPPLISGKSQVHRSVVLTMHCVDCNNQVCLPEYHLYFPLSSYSISHVTASLNCRI